MKLEIFSIFDDKARNFATPFFMLNEAMALRAFNDVATDGNSNISRNPTDYKLYRIGNFDDSTGFIEKLEIPEFVALAPERKPTYEPQHEETADQTPA